METGTKELIKKSIAGKTLQMTDPAGRPVRVLEDKPALQLTKRHGCGLLEIYIAALEQGVWPYRYLRNRDIFSVTDQLRLARSRVAVIGAGGLGGTVILLLARIGIGALTVADGDVFDETNLNRQALSDMSNLGLSKAEQADARVDAINPAVEMTTHQTLVGPDNIESILTGAQVVVDALDNIPDRLMLGGAARNLNLPLVHGALAGFDGQVMTVFPDDQGLERIYGGAENLKGSPERPEAVLGVPALTPAIVATLQVMEVIKILLDRGRLIRNRMLHVDLEGGRFDSFLF